ncbi:MAG TPA: hypothetical protein VEA69_08870 [Tepidisphaeraceae bacterium]|nr:hypothetical protein [Tepidisphaeraceae bacterium]
MTTAPPAPEHLTQEALEAALPSPADARVVFVPEWALEHLIESQDAAGTRVRVLGLPAGRLAQLSDEMDLTPPAAEGGGLAIVLARPDPDVLMETPAARVLVYYWRLLFHARVRAQVAAALVDDVGVQRRIHRLGRPEFNEARFVLLKDRFLSAGAGDGAAYAEFAALYLSLSCFQPAALAAYFPSIADHAAVRALLHADVAADALFEATRPAGAGDPTAVLAPAEPPTAERLATQAASDAGRVDALLAKAGHADAVGNDVRSAILRMRASRTGRTDSAAVRAAAGGDLDDLVRRLTPALHLSPADAAAWRAALGELLDNAAGGWWNSEGRLLYDLQTVCVHHERELYSVNVVGWCLERGKRPLKRPQPDQRLVLALKALRSAIKRTNRARVSETTRQALRRLLHSAVAGVEHALRTALRPQIDLALAEGGLRPRSVTEEVARAKLLEELLDTIVQRGYLRFSDVRDAISRNQVKLDDLSGRDFLSGDALLRIDKRLAQRLDQVYHHGEIYLRGFHRMSATFFGTPWGRLVTRFAILPLALSYLILGALDHSVGKFLAKPPAGKTEAVAGVAQTAAEALAPTQTATGHAAASHPAVFAQAPIVLGLAGFLLLLINVPPFRRATWVVTKHVGRALHAALIAGPRWVFTRPAFRALYASRAAKAVWRYVLKPGAVAAVVWLFIPDTTPAGTQVGLVAGVFVVANLVLNTRSVRRLEQEVRHRVRTAVTRYAWDALVAVGRGIMAFFQYLLEAVDRLLYAVDEALRFRPGQSKPTVALKAVFGIFWFYIAYFFRFCITLLVEPQVNPIKHFPVVTVSHKLLFPTIPLLGDLFINLGVEKTTAYAYATTIIWCIPGVFGFLAWEFKENWKLYHANRPRKLKPVKVGSHGETMAGFICPGFHSGTLPKAYARLRKLAARGDTDPESSAKARHAIEHAEHALHALVEREFLALVNRHPLFATDRLELHALHLATTQVRVTIAKGDAHRSHNSNHDHDAHATPPADAMTIVFEQRSGWVMASIATDTLTPALSSAQRDLLSTALLGFYKLSAVDLIAEQIGAVVGAPGAPVDVRRRRELVVWPTADDAAAPAVYSLAGEGALEPVGGGPAPTLDRVAVVYRSATVSRDAWDSLWTGIGSGDAFPKFRVLPGT